MYGTNLNEVKIQFSANEMNKSITWSFNAAQDNITLDDGTFWPIKELTTTTLILSKSYTYGVGYYTYIETYTVQ